MQMPIKKRFSSADSHLSLFKKTFDNKRIQKSDDGSKHNIKIVKVLHLLERYTLELFPTRILQFIF
jgi:hypothetical protein